MGPYCGLGEAFGWAVSVTVGPGTGTPITSVEVGPGTGTPTTAVEVGPGTGTTTVSVDTGAGLVVSCLQAASTSNEQPKAAIMAVLRISVP